MEAAEVALKSVLPHPWFLSNGIGLLARLDNGKNGILPFLLKILVLFAIWRYYLNFQNSQQFILSLKSRPTRV